MRLFYKACILTCAIFWGANAATQPGGVLRAMMCATCLAHAVWYVALERAERPAP